MELSPDASFGPYRLVEPAGAGGMAEVWRAYDGRLDRFVAIKFLSRRYADDPDYLERFRREARAISRLDHPNVLPIWDFGEQDGWTYMVSPFLTGGSLDQRLRSAWPTAAALQVIQPLATALDYAHAAGIVHRDVKPSNVLFSADGRLVLGDFGVARLLEGSPVLTSAGVGIGTPAYMSPEQAQGEPVGPASDLYSLGIVAYELLTGRRPFEAETPMAVALAQIQRPLPPPRSLNPTLSEKTERALFKALAKRPADRFPNGAAFVQALTNALQDEPTLDLTRISGPAWPDVTARSAPKSMRGRATVGIVVGLAVLAAGAFVLVRNNDQPRNGSATATTLVVRTSPTALPAPALVAPPTSAPAASAVAIQPPPATRAAPTASPQPTLDPLLGLVREGDELLAQDLKAAVAKYQQAVSGDPNRALAHRQLGTALFWLADNRGYLPQLEQATQLDPRDARAWAYLSVAYLAEYQYDRASQAADQATSLDPAAAESKAAQAMQSVLQNDLPAARSAVADGLRTNPASALIQWANFLVLLADGDPDGALAAIEQLARQGPSWAATHVLRGDALLWRQRTDEARHEFEEALRIDPQLLWVHTRIGWLDLGTNNPTEANQMFQAGLQRDPRDASATSGLGYVAFGQGDQSGALDYFKRAIDIDSRAAHAYIGRGMVLTLGLNQHLEAEANFRKALEIAPRSADAMLGIGITQYKRNQWDLALSSFQAAQALPPPNAYTSMWIAATLSQLNRLPEARQAAEQANAMKPGDPTIQQVLTQIKQRGG